VFVLYRWNVPKYEYKASQCYCTQSKHAGCCTKIKHTQLSRSLLCFALKLDNICFWIAVDIYGIIFFNMKLTVGIAQYV